jgi:hypothetical protein
MAFVSYGFVLVRVRVRVDGDDGGDGDLSFRRAFICICMRHG